MNEDFALLKLTLVFMMDYYVKEQGLVLDRDLSLELQVT